MRGSREKQRNLLPIRDLLKGAFSPLIPDQKSSLQEMQERWEEIVSFPLGRETRPTAIAGKRLLLKVNGSSWASEIQLRQREILAQLKEIFPHLGLEELRCHLR